MDGNSYLAANIVRLTIHSSAGLAWVVGTKDGSSGINAAKRNRWGPSRVGANCTRVMDSWGGDQI